MTMAEFIEVQQLAPADLSDAIWALAVLRSVGNGLNDRPGREPRNGRHRLST
jgi:hypothetical protein